MTTSPDLGLPFIAEQQSQPEISHNEAIAMLSALLKGVIALGDNSPPGSPTDGDTYVVGTSPTGLWAGKANKIAIYLTNAWVFVPGFDSDGSDIPMGTRQYGLSVYVQGDDQGYYWNGTIWTDQATPATSADHVSYVPEDASYSHNVQTALDELFGAISSPIRAESIEYEHDYSSNVEQALDQLFGANYLNDAPDDSTTYARKNGSWAHIQSNDIAYDGQYSSNVMDALDELFAGGGSGGGGGIPDAPGDHTFYGRKDNEWVNPTASEVAIEELPNSYGSNVQESLGELSGRLVAVESEVKAPVLSVQDAIYKEMAEANMTMTHGASGTLYDRVIDKGGFVILLLAGTTRGTTFRPGTSWTVPAGKIAVSVGSLFDSQTYFDTTFYRHRLYNVSSAVAVGGPNPTYGGAGSGNALGSNAGWTGIPFAEVNVDIPLPAPMATEGQSLRAELAGGSDTNDRPTFGLYILGIIDSTTHKLDPVI